MPLLNHSIKDRTLFIELNDPHTHNSFSPQMAEEFLVCLKNSNEFDCVVVTHQGPYFCSGGNLPFYHKLKTKEEGLEFNKKISEILLFFSQMDILKIVYVNGITLGGGVEFLSSFDLVFASPSSFFGLWQRRIGLTLGWESEVRLKNRLGDLGLKKWLLSAKTISAYEAMDIGLVDQIVLPHNYSRVLKEIMESNARLGIQSLKGIQSIVKNQSQVFEELWLSEDHKRALNSFNKK